MNDNKELSISEKDDYLKFLYFKAMIDIAELWGNQEIGTCEVNILELSKYCNSVNFNFDIWEVSGRTEEEIKNNMYEFITNLILEGFPIWRMLKLSNFTKNMIEKTFENDMNKKYEELCKKYKCYTCVYYKKYITSFGSIEKCDFVSSKKYKRNINLSSRNNNFKLKKTCKDYISVKNKEE